MPKKEQSSKQFLEELGKNGVGRGAIYRGISIRGVIIENKTLEGVNLPQSDFREVKILSSSLKDSNLERIDLRNGIIKGSNLYGVNLRRSKLKSLRISASDLNKADLTECNLSLGTIEESDLTSSSMKSSHLSKLKIHNSTLKETDLSQIIAPYITFKNTDLTSSTFNDSLIEGATMEAVSLVSSEFRNVHAITSHFINVDFSGADLRGSDFTGSTFSDSVFEETDLRGVIFDQCFFKNTPLRNCSLTGASFHSVSGLTDEVTKSIKAGGAKVSTSFVKNILSPLSKSIYFRLLFGAILIGLFILFALYLLNPENKTIDALENDCENLKKARKFEKAERYYRIILEKVRGNPDMEIATLFSIAEMQIEGKKYESAEETLKDIIKRTADDPEQRNLARSNLSNLYLMTNKLEKAKDICMQIIEDKESSSIEVGEALASIARVYLSMGERDKAKEILLENLERFRENPAITYETNLVLADILRKEGEYEKALDIYRRLEKFVTLESQMAEILIIEAGLFEEMGDYATSMKIFEDIIRRFPENPDVSFDVKMDIANMILQKGNYDYAIKVYQNILDTTKNPDTRGAVLLSMARGGIEHQPEEAERLFQKVITEFSNRKDMVFDAMRGLVELHIYCGKFDSALTILEKMEKEMPELMRGEDYIKKGEVLLQKGLNDEAIELMKKILNKREAIEEIRGRALSIWAEGLIRKGEIEGAMKIYNSEIKGLKEKELIASIFNRGAELLVEKKRFEEAKRLYDTICKIASLDKDLLSTAKLGLAGIYEEEGRLKEALSLYKEVAEYGDPEIYVRAMEAMADGYIGRGNFFRGIEILREAVSKIPSGSPIFFEVMQKMANLYSERGDKKEALKIFEEITKRSSSNEVRGLALIRKAEILSDMGEIEEAKQIIEDSISRFRSSTEVSERGEFILAQIWRLEGKKDKAVSTLKKLNAHAKNQEIREMSGLALQEMMEGEDKVATSPSLPLTGDEEDAIMKKLKEAESQFSRGDFKGAFESYSGIEKEIDDKTLIASILIRKGEALYYSGEKDKAKEELSNILKESSNSDEIFLNAAISLVRIFMAEGKDDEALELLRSCLKRKGDETLLKEMKERMADIYLKKENLREAEKLYREIGGTGLYAHLLELAEKSEEKGEVNHALSLYREVMEKVVGDDASLYASMKGFVNIIKIREGSDSVLKHIASLKERFKDNRKTLFQIYLIEAETLMEMGRIEEVISILKDKEKTDIDREMKAKLKCLLARAYHLKGERAVSLKLFEEVSKSYGDIESAILRAGMGIAEIRREQNLRPEAIKVYKELLKKIKDEGLRLEVLNGLKETYEEMGDEGKALEFKKEIERSMTGSY